MEEYTSLLERIERIEALALEQAMKQESFRRLYSKVGSHVEYSLERKHVSVSVIDVMGGEEQIVAVPLEAIFK